MDTRRIFESLPEWTRALGPDQADLLNRLMLAANTKGFSGIPAEEMRRIQEHLLHSGEDASRQYDMKCAASRLAPVISNTAFI